MLSLSLPGHVSQVPGFAGQPRAPPRLAETRSTRSCRRCAPCCPSLPRRRSASPTSTPWPWCASACGGPSSSLQVPSARLYRTLWSLALCGALPPPDPRRRFTLIPCRLGSSCGTGPWHRTALPAPGLPACALGRQQAGLHLRERGSGPGPLRGKACSLGTCTHCPHTRAGAFIAFTAQMLGRGSSRPCTHSRLCTHDASQAQSLRAAPLCQVELLAQGDTVFDIMDGRVGEDVHKKLLLAREEPGRGKGSLGWHLMDFATSLWPWL